MATESLVPDGEVAVASFEIDALTKDLRMAAQRLGIDEVRYLVDFYYQLQEPRKAAANRVNAARNQKPSEPTLLLTIMQGKALRLERQIKVMLEIWTEAEPSGVCRWAKSIVGIGPILSAGLMAHIDIAKAPTVGHIWRFAGLDPTLEWKKRQKRPWNADLKVLCYKAGESFVKVQNHPRDFYGSLFADYKKGLVARNERGDFADAAKAQLARFDYGEETVAYAAYTRGQLPDAHIHARARRWIVKLFLAHWHEVAYSLVLHEAPPKPYIFSIGGHDEAHRIAPPNFP